MIDELIITIPGAAVPWSVETRTRRTRAGRRYPGMKNTAESAAYRERVKSAMWLAAHQAGWEMTLGPVALEIVSYRRPPKSRPKVRALELREAYPVGTPDCTNLLKCAEDGGKGILWKDDAQVCDSNFKKRYASSPEAERLEIRVTLITEMPEVDLGPAMEVTP